ncbi:MAG: glutamate-5-semialdehyde dehydrogenase [Alphaproteobacteria bacterium]|nr:glutamate-5-semialdehyde dehydrogenase [Alphaproteobacteria bacterium]
MSEAALEADLLNSSPEEIVLLLGRAAKDAAHVLSQTSTQTINNVLDSLADALVAQTDTILAANARDIEAARAKGLSAAMVDRLLLDAVRVAAIAQGVRVVEDLPDPTGRVLSEVVRPNGLRIEKVSVPIGVLGMIYESRPNVTVDAAVLCLKSHNAVILRGGSESLYSSLALHKIIQETLESFNLPAACVSMIPTGDRAAVGAMLRMNEYIDVMIPRGGKGLIERVMAEARMPVFGHLEGVCHVYVDASVRPDIARSVPFNAKLRRTGVCNAMETLLLDKNLDKGLAQEILAQLLDAGCEIVGDKLVQGIDARIGAATAEDWSTEYLDKKLSCCVVDGVREAVRHINTYGTHHTDSILAEDAEAVQYFFGAVDSGVVMHNASTQFTDGGEFGMGAEIGIATGKMQARGPVGLEQLCTYKYLVHGTGQTRP